jgi:hypothetical protein
MDIFIDADEAQMALEVLAPEIDSIMRTVSFVENRSDQELRDTYPDKDAEWVASLREMAVSLRQRATAMQGVVDAIRSAKSRDDG